MHRTSSSWLCKKQACWAFAVLFGEMMRRFRQPAVVEEMFGVTDRAVGRFSSVQAWIDSIDKVGPLRPTRIVPSYGEMGRRISHRKRIERLKALQIPVAELKGEGKTVDQTADTVTAEFRAKYPNWTGSAAATARVAFNETK